MTKPSVFHNAALVLTTISGPNKAMKAFADGCKKNNTQFIVIGDTKTPSDFSLDGCMFVSIAEQRSLSYKIAKLLPEKHYARKNIGYLLAKELDFIIESDDDNFPREEFWNKPPEFNSARTTDRKGWINAYHFFSDEQLWPRGFPLEELNNQTAVAHHSADQKTLSSIRIIQGLADENPDVDAVYRMTSKLPVSFSKSDPLILSDGSWCPFNSQNTVWHKEAFPLLYLPSYCSFRMTDIWRSFVAQRIAWTCGWSLLFHSADVWQERNEHSLLKDFADEVPGYLNNSRMCRMLEDLDLKTGAAHLCENLMRCYKLLTSEGWVGNPELALAEAWCEEF